MAQSAADARFGHADLRVDVLDVMIGGLGGDEEPLGDLARREPLRDEAKYLDLAAAEPSRVPEAVRLGRQVFAHQLDLLSGVVRGFAEIHARYDLNNWDTFWS